MGYLVDTPIHLTQLDEQGAALAAAAERAGVDAAVPTCPQWNVRELLAHVGMVHRWAATHVREGKAAFAGGVSPDFPAPQDGVVEWFRAGHAGLLEALRDAPDDLEAMTFLAESGRPRAFWARRQAHETAIHRADAEAAAGTTASFDREFALDGIAELLEGFYGRRSSTLRADPPISVRVAPDDADLTWLIELRPDEKVITRDGAGTASCTLRGPASAVYRTLWNRGGEVQIAGDEHAMTVWRTVARVAWH